MRFVRLLLMALSCAHGAHGARAALAVLPDWEQRRELWANGEITDRDENTWDVLMVPGARSIGERAERGWHDGGVALTSLVHRPFWKKRTNEGARGLRSSNEAIRKRWLKAIAEDFIETRRENDRVAPGEIGSVFFPAVNWAWFGAKSIARTAWMPLGASSGVVYGAAKPILSVVGTPLIEAGAYDVLTRGIAVPATLYAWNAFAWVALSRGNVPTRESSFVRLAHREDDVVIEREQLERLAQVAVLKRLTEDRVAALNARIQDIEADAEARKRPLREEQRATIEGFARASSGGVSTRMLEQARKGTRVRLSPDAATLYVDERKLNDVIERSLREAGVEKPSPALVATIRERLVTDLQALHVEGNGERR